MGQSSQTSVVFLIQKDGKCLFLEHPETTEKVKAYHLPKGFVQKDELIMNCAVRVLSEQFSVIVDKIDLRLKMIHQTENGFYFIFKVAPELLQNHNTNNKFLNPQMPLISNESKELLQASGII
ncbi:MAG: NUDIX domain-containing protein [Alphaproteobacteria bacterium]|nr:NUDIX domain-containing protein [Alphaproteobacteria bacterium]